MARKDRERARKRRAIDRSRRDAGFDERPKEDKPDRPSSNGRRPPNRPPQRGRGPQAPLRKLGVGDVDRRGRVFKRAMIIHPRIAMFISLGVIALAVVGLFGLRLQWLSYLAFSVGFLVFADSRPTWVQTWLWVGVAAICAVASIVLLVAVI